MATGSVLLAANAAVLGDGSTDNVPCGMSRRVGSLSGIDNFFLTLDFDGAGSTVESAWWSFRMPADYASGGALKILWMANGTSNAVKFAAQVSAITADDADTPLEHALSTAATVTTNVNTTEARRVTASSITLNMDSAAAGDLIQLVLKRDPSDGSDTSTADAEVLACAFEYTTT